MNEELVQDAKRLYESGLSLKNVSLIVGVPKATLRDNLLKIMSLRDKSESRRINNYKLFSTLTGESAYWLGFIAADGYITDRMIKLKLSIKDKDHLEKFKTFTGIDREICIQDDGNSCVFIVHSVNDVEDICKYLPAKDKTSRIDIPKIPNDLLPDFIRGYFDGDGHVGQYGNKRSVTIASVSSILYSFDDLFRSMNMKTYVYPERHTIIMQGKNSIRKFYEFCNSGKSKVRMDRKWNRYDEIMESMK